MSNIDPITLYLQFCHVFTSLQEKTCTRNRVRFTKLQSIGSDLYKKGSLVCLFLKLVQINFIFTYIVYVYLTQCARRVSGITLIRYVHNQDLNVYGLFRNKDIYIKPNNLKVFGSKNNPQDINTISKISHGHLSLREENFS